MKRQFAENLMQAIEILISEAPDSDDDRMHLSILGEIKERLYAKLGKPKTDFGMTFTPAQAIALRILFTDYVKIPTTYLGNKLHTIAVEVAQQYN
jgi:hypothetical protein